METDPMKTSVGAIIRAFRTLPNSKQISCRGMITTVNTIDNTASIIWESSIPKPLPSVKNERSDESTFLITPNESKEEEEEDTLSIDALNPLFSFESNEKQNWTADKCKEHGDTLLRVHDYVMAISWYERALSITSQIQIGSTIILRRGFGTIIAHVDCIEENKSGTLLDIVHEKDEYEESIKKEDVLLVMEQQTETFLQERILLNLSRCLLQMSETYSSLSTMQKEAYRKSAILACTLVITSSSFYHENPAHTIFEEKAKYIRAKLYISLNKFKHANVDIKQILRQTPNHKDTLVLQKQLETKRKKKKKVDKQLAKDMCQWVQTATDETKHNMFWPS